MSAVRSFARLLAAQRLWLRGGLLLAATLGLADLPPAAAWLCRARALTPEELATVFCQFGERYLPLWALLAGSLVWSDAEPAHRPLLLAWRVRPAELLLAKVLAAGLLFLPLALAAAYRLPALYARATGGALPVAGLLLQRSFVPALCWLALAAVAGAAGRPAAGTAAGGLFWLLQLSPGVPAWLDRCSAGALNLFAWTAGTRFPLAAVGLRTAFAALILLGCAWAVLAYLRGSIALPSRVGRHVVES